MITKIFISIFILMLLFLAGCSQITERKVCQKLGYDDYNWKNRIVGDDNFFCFKEACGAVEVSRVYTNVDDALIDLYRQDCGRCNERDYDD